jgi:hypothetical protein
MSVGTILLILVIVLLGGLGGPYIGAPYGYGYGHGGVGVVGILVIVLVVLLLMRVI